VVRVDVDVDASKENSMKAIARKSNHHTGPAYKFVEIALYSVFAIPVHTIDPIACIHT
jgi:hypothetical protein